MKVDVTIRCMDCPNFDKKVCEELCQYWDNENNKPKTVEHFMEVTPVPENLIDSFISKIKRKE